MNKVALVTGGAKRVGREIALTLARSGMDIAITYNKSAEDAESLIIEIEKLGQDAIAIQVDKAQDSAAETIYQALIAKFNRLDALINNASTFEPSAFIAVEKERLDRDMAVNAYTPLQLTQKLAPMLAARFSTDDPASTGRIVNLVDIHVLGEPLRDHVSYNLSKAALLEVTNSAALELAPAITVNAIAPGVVAWADFYTEETKQEYLKKVPLARAGTPADVAAAVRFLVQDADYCTGQVIQIDGGRHLT